MGLRVGACLSLSGRYARFGSQAALGLQAWRALDGDAELVAADDRSDPVALEAALGQVGADCDVLLGPYSTHLMKVAGRVAARAGWLVWNHGGAGDDAQAARPGHVVSVLTPASRYVEPFTRELARRERGSTLWVVHGKGGFGRQVAAGAQAAARRHGIEVTSVGPDAWPAAGDPPSTWDLFSAGGFDEDVEIVRRALAMRRPPRLACAVAAGVREFGVAAREVAGSEVAGSEVAGREVAVGGAGGVYGVGQWFPGVAPAADPGAPDAGFLGPAEADFLAAYLALSGAVPDYPAVQAAACAALAAHCARQAGGTGREAMWQVASRLDARTLFGRFKIDPASGVQVGHDAVLVRWVAGELVPG